MAQTDTPAKKAAPAAAQKYDAPVRDVVWLERTIPCYEPSDEQFTAVLRLAKLPSSADGVSVKRMLATLNRVPELCRMLMADEDDQEWMEDGIAFKRIKLDQLPEFLFGVIEAWWGEQSRATRRRTPKRTTARLTQ